MAWHDMQGNENTWLPLPTVFVRALLLGALMPLQWEKTQRGEKGEGFTKVPQNPHPTPLKSIALLHLFFFIAVDLGGVGLFPTCTPLSLKKFLVAAFAHDRQMHALVTQRWFNKSKNSLWTSFDKPCGWSSSVFWHQSIVNSNNKSQEDPLG